jgi:hypothetical protein
MRAEAVVPLLAAVGLGLAACSPATVCTTIGYPSTARITLAEPRDDVDLEVCAGEGCEPGPSPGDAAAEPVRSGAPANEDSGIYALRGDGSTGWTADFSGTEDEMGYRLLGADGAAIAEGGVRVEWVRVGGTEECGGPQEAEIELPG